MNQIDYRLLSKAVSKGVLCGLIDFAVLTAALWIAGSILGEVLS